MKIVNLPNRVSFSHPSLRKKLFVGLLTVILSVALPATAETLNLTVSGTVISSACTIVTADKNLTVDLKTIESRALTLAPSAVQKFTINLENCDISVLKSSKVTIKGSAATGKTTHLALDASSQASGFAIGFKQGAGSTKDFPINTASDPITLTADKSKLEFGAYAEKLPTGTIASGTFNAKATVEVEYL
ncbi:hypothetical protein C9426_28045 [Serratia sp. S1B]|nr:hypothetical protein C9426_28045 [Serratia sp. S1B]